MLRNSLIALLLVFITMSASAQVLSPSEMSDDGMRVLQDKYFDQLKAFGAEARAHKFPYQFSFSRVVDVAQPEQGAVDQRSIHFDRYDGRVDLVITGNYFASYSEKLMDYNHRVRQDFSDVVLPLLNMVVPRLAGAGDFQGYAFEVSHHLRGRALGIGAERAENLVFIFPKNAAERLVQATTNDQRQAAVLDAQVLVDGEPFTMWLTGDPPKGDEHPRKLIKPAASEVATLQPVAMTQPIDPTVNPKLLGLPTPPPRIVNAEMLGNLAVQYDADISRMLKELDSQAHFVSYAPPNFIAFHNGAYLQVGLQTPLDASLAGSSRYKLAALAFDEHIAHLVRATLAYFPGNVEFDGIDFSTTIKTSVSPSAESVEFVLPVKALRCYADYSCTGQQLLDSGFVLINGDRVQLDLQVAEK
ncbi:MAG TPA: hypothetical protein VJT08_07755 [Terriglobales bacterium]|nr:hypothetical protein [Terriglobales bacterium]